MRRRREKVASLVPNGMSMLNLIFGFLSIISAVEGNFMNAAFFIFLGALADGADGKLARKMKAVSDMGVEFDSLADLVTFGLAPAVMLYLYVFNTLNYGIFIPILIIASAALRLARFNVSHEVNYFEGMPTPAVGFFAGAYIVSGIVLEARVLAVIFALVSLLMVSQVKYPTFKMTSKKRFAVLVLLAGGLVGAAYYYPIFILAPFLLYAFGGPFVLKWSRR